MLQLINGDFRDIVLESPVRMIFADPPDNLKLGYSHYDDCLSNEEYSKLLHATIRYGMSYADVVWISYNARYTDLMGYLIYTEVAPKCDWEVKHCVQTFTFGTYNPRDLSNDHRPLVRLMKKGTVLYPDAIRVPSQRQLQGDKRADPRGRVPSDIFNFPRVTGNSGQRRKYHPTQLHEGLYERCIRLCCQPEDMVCDIFAGTGTLARACKVTKNPCILIEIDPNYCDKIAEEHKLNV